MTDHYQVLGIPKTATPDEIKRAYRTMASKHHPDKGGTNERFQEIQAAYAVLGDPQKRAAYDNPQPQHNFGFNFNGFDFADIFAAATGQPFGQRGNAGRPEQLYRTTMWVTLEQIAHGDEVPVHLKVKGQDRIAKIKIPKGLDNGTRIRYNDVIEDAALVVDFKMYQHQRFQRDGLNLVTSSRVSVFDLLLGTRIQVETLTGETLEVTVPAATQPNQMMKLRGKGLQNAQATGDLYVRFEVYVPTITAEFADTLRTYITTNQEGQNAK